MLIQRTKPSETILGYTLREKIGVGGYGEVWVAEAPGGLTKAVKLIFGYHDEGRAQRELKALNRIKEVRHPFLLSLERIDIIDGRLVVVTELAECSLKDRFREYVEQGEVGIPRDELLRYLTDAAEALDYIYGSHSLLHLDVKPENLLLVGGHVKLADFGLVKDVQETSVSQMGGLTPTYAAPEVFEGKPSDRSDQYSLAIVFQEMLTGKRPFSGTTPAKLAIQHLHEVPEMTFLSPGDQGPMRRALAKSPEARFPTCRAFIDELARRRGRSRRRRSDKLATRTPDPTPIDTFSHTVATPMSGIASMAQKTTDERMPPLDVDTDGAGFSPTLFIGVGHTATTVLQHLKRRFHERLGEQDARPSLRILCLDTDTINLDDAQRMDNGGCLQSDEVLPLPLKTSSEYREKADAHLAWMSRRWIYNIPRSRQTEGLRPLGRLALVDHHEKITERLHQIMAEITDQDAIVRTAKRCELVAASRDPKVYIVASISGGSGSGMVADLAYLVRLVLADRGLRDYPVVGVLLASTGKMSASRDISVANAYCCLNEIYHYSHVGGYPGDSSCDIPEFVDCPSFDYVYYLDIGDEPLADEYTGFADGVAEYLFLDTATACGQYFEACRDDGPLIDENMYLRTLGISHSGGDDSDAVSQAAKVVCHRLISSWVQKAPIPTNAVPSTDLLQLGHDSDLLTNRVLDRLANELRQDPRELIASALRPLLGEPNGGEDLVQSAEDAVDVALGIDRRRSTRALRPSIRFALDATVEAVAGELFQQIETAVLASLDDCGSRVTRSEAHLAALDNQLSEVSESIAAKKKTWRDQLDPICQQIAASGSQDAGQVASPESLPLAESVQQYADLRFHEFLATATKRVADQVQSQLVQVTAKLNWVRNELTRMSQQFESRSTRLNGEGFSALSTSASAITSVMLESTNEKIQSLIADLDQTLQQRCFQSEGGFLGPQEVEERVWFERTKNAIFRHARSLIAAQTRVQGLDAMLAEYGVSDEQVTQWVKESVNLATPNVFATCGGKSRLVVAVPRGSDAILIQESLEATGAGHGRIMPVTDGDVAFCFEVGFIPVHQVAALLLQSCPRSADLVSRLHTRIDVQWSSLIQLN